MYDLAFVYKRPEEFYDAGLQGSLPNHFHPLVSILHVLLPVFRLRPFSQESLTCEQVLKDYSKMWKLNV